MTVENIQLSDCRPADIQFYKRIVPDNLDLSRGYLDRYARSNREANTWLRETVAKNRHATVQIRDFLTAAIQDIRTSFSKGNRRVVLKAPCGTGKTWLAAQMIRQAADKGRTAMFLADSLLLVEQTADLFENKFDLRCGILQGNHPKTDLTLPVQVGTVQTLGRRKVPQYDLVIADECHIKSKALYDYIDKHDPYVVGLTATPYAKGMGLVYQDLIKISLSYDDLIDRDMLVPYQAHTHPGVDASKLKTGASGDYAPSDSDLAYTQDLMADVVKTFREIPGLPPKTIGFAPTVAKAEGFAQLFRCSGFASEAIHAKMSDDDTRDMIQRFADGTTTVLWSVVKLIKGFDQTDVMHLVWCRPTKSKMLFQQAIGRGARSHPGKTGFTIADHAGTFRALGRPELFDIDELDKAKPGEKSAADRVSSKVDLSCPACGVVKKPGQLTCPICFHKQEKQTHRIKGVEMEYIDGKLVPLEKKSTRMASPKMERLRAKGKQQIYAELLWHARVKGWARGAVSHYYRAIFGVWPVNFNPAAVPTSNEVSAWITSQNIRYSKRR